MAVEEARVDGVDFFRDLLEAAPDALVVIDGPGNIVFANAQVELLFGYPRSQMLGKHFGILLPSWHVDNNASAREGFAIDPRMRRVGTDLKLFGRHRDGTEFPIEISFVPLGSGSGMKIVASVRDVSERHRIDVELRNALSLLNATLESTADGILVVTNDGQIASSNEQFTTLWGIPADLMASPGDKLMAFVVGQLVDPNKFQDKVQELYATPNAESLDVLEFLDGRTLEMYSRPQRVGEEVVGRVWSFRDVTSRDYAQAQARALGAIVNSAPDAIVGKDTNGIITSWNPGAARLYGYTSAEAIGRDVEFLVPVHLREYEEAILADVAASGNARSYETDRVRQDGTIVPISLTVSAIRGEHGVRGIAAIGQDITERRAAEAELLAAREAALESSRLKSEFLATMSHEIRTPMNGVVGLTALLLDTALDETQRKYAEGVSGAADALLSLINDILDFSKLEAGKVELDVTPFDPRLLVEEVAALLAEPAQSKNLELIAYCLPEVPVRLNGDAGRIRQILLNLASNAVKFTATGEVAIRVTVSEHVAEKAMVRFEVRDSGIGIDPGDHLRLFESFSQVDASTTRRYGGTGLGLAICRRLTVAMGGAIGVTSALGEGSTFWFMIPLPVSEAPAEAPDLLVPGMLTGLRVLVVDDNATNRFVLESQLNAWGLLPEAVADASTALDLARTAAAAGRPYDIAVLDMVMPDKDGLELATELLAEPALQRIKLMMLTSTTQVTKAALAEAGIHEWLTKPVRSSELFDRLMRLAATSVPASHMPAPYRPARPERTASRGRILVVEDNAVNQLVAQGMVAKLGFDADVVADGVSAVSATAARPYVAVLMDCHMPIMDGFEATRTIRARGDHPARLPIIAMTAGAQDEDRERCFAAGMDDYLTKPVNVDALEEALARWVPPTTPGPERSPAVDPARLATLRDLGPADGQGLLPAATRAFREGVPPSLADLHRAMSSGGGDALKRAAHKLRGAAANIGATIAAALCQELEHLGGEPDSQPGPDLLARLEIELTRVDTALELALEPRS